MGLAALPRREIGRNRDDIGNGLAVAQHAHGLTRFDHIEIGLGMVPHFGKVGLFHVGLAMYKIV